MELCHDGLLETGFWVPGMQLTVILSTYNSPDWLEKVLWGYAAQTHRDFELVIADDGSGDETRQRIEKLRQETNLPIRHVWHPDDGFQKSAILNKAITATRYEYLVFSDGDCIPRNDFLAVHAARAEIGRFLSGGYTKLGLEASRTIDREHIESGEAFEPQWLAAHGLAARAFSKHAAGGRWAPLYNSLTPTNPSWNVHNASGWTSDRRAIRASCRVTPTRCSARGGGGREEAPRPPFVLRV